MRFANSILVQSVGAILVAMGLCMAALLFASSSQITAELEETFVTNSTNITAFTSNQINTGTRLKRSAMIEPQLNALLQDEGLAVAAVRVTHIDNIEIANLTGESYDQLGSSLFSPADFSEVPTAVSMGDYLTVRTPIHLGAGDDRVLVGELAMVWDKASYLESATQLSNFMTKAFAATALIVAAVATLSMIGLVGRPLSKIIAAMSAVSSGQDKVSLPKARSHEMSAMVDTVKVFLNLTEERTKLLAELKSVISKAEEGDFSGRLYVEAEKSEDQTDLRVIVNSLLMAVDDGLNATIEAMEQLSRRDLTVQMDGDFKGAFKKLSDDVNYTTRELNLTLSQVLHTAHRVGEAAEELNSSSDDLSNRTHHNAATLEETAAAISMIADAVSSSAGFANKAKEESGRVTEHATTGKDVVDALVEKMNSIQKNSENISAIVALIDDVAFQTSLLSLNAGVEAARAGEHGKGFAVVASEVRALAQRTSESASKIKGLVSTSSTEIANGVEKASAAGRSITEIVNAIGLLTQQIGEISTMADDQASSISEIRSAINDLDVTTQKNASMVSKTSDLSNDLQTDSKSMLDALNQFTVAHVNRDDSDEIRLSA